MQDNRKHLGVLKYYTSSAAMPSLVVTTNGGDAGGCLEVAIFCSVNHRDYAGKDKAKQKNAQAQSQNRQG